MKPETIQTARLILDQPLASDIDTMTAHCQDPIFEQFLPLPWPYKREHAEYYIEQYVPENWESGIDLNWAIRAADRPQTLMGVVGIRRDNGAVGYWLGSTFRGRGYLPEALNAVLEWVVGNNILEASAITWSCFAGNVASAQVARKTGFVYRGIGPSPTRDRNGQQPEAWLAHYVGEISDTQLSSWPDFTYPPRTERH